MCGSVPDALSPGGMHPPQKSLRQLPKKKRKEMRRDRDAEKVLKIRKLDIVPYT